VGSDAARSDARTGDLQKDLAGLRATEKSLRSELEGARDEIRQLADAQRKAAESAQALDELRTELQRERESMADLRRSRGEAEGDLASKRNAISDLRHDLEQAERRLLFEAGEKAQLLASNEDLQRQIAAATERLQPLDAELQAARIRLMDLESPKRPVVEPPAPAPAPAHGRAKAAAAKASPSLPAGRPPAPDDGGWIAVRMATRYAFRQQVDVQINGNAGTLCDISVAGCQLLSPTALKPNQAVKVVLPTEPKPLSCSGKIVWATLEPPALGRPARYRVGIQFQKANETALEKFIGAHATIG
jgi:hypothetical protein